MRQYEFVRAGNISETLAFTARQFHYADRDCRTEPLYTITSWGEIKLDRSSWLVPGATETAVTLHTAEVVPHTHLAATLLAKRLEFIVIFSGTVF